MLHWLRLKAGLTFGGMAVCAGIIGTYIYNARKAKEMKLQGSTLYYHETQDEYRVAAKKLDETLKTANPKFNDLMKSGKVSTCFVGWDNPRYLITPMQSRSAAGIMVDNSLVEDETVKQIVKEKKLKSVKLPPTDVVAFDINPGDKKTGLYRLCWWFMYKRYLARYRAKMAAAQVAFFPMGHIKKGDSNLLFVPLPDQVKNYEFSSVAEPEMNPVGAAHKNEFVKTVAKPAQAPKPVSVVPPVVQPTAEKKPEVEAPTKPVAKPEQKYPRSSHNST